MKAEIKEPQRCFVECLDESWNKRASTLFCWMSVLKHSLNIILQMLLVETCSNKVKVIPLTVTGTGLWHRWFLSNLILESGGVL